MANSSNTVKAASASAFIDSLGVNAHIDSGTSSWMDVAKISKEMNYLGVHNIRDGTPYDWALGAYKTLATQGIKFDLTQENPVAAVMTQIGSSYDVTRAAALERLVPGSVIGMEGANEYNITKYNFNGTNTFGNVGIGKQIDADLQSAVKGSSVLHDVNVVAASTSGATSLPNVGANVDVSNAHVYAGVGQNLHDSMAAGIALAQSSAPGKPVWITEAGISSSGYGSSSWGVADAYTQGIVDTNAYLDAFKMGASKTFLYDLMDEPNRAATDQEAHFGLFNPDGSAKPVAVNIHNLTSILADSGTATATGSLAYHLDGLPATASSMLLEKSNGVFDLVVWNGDAILSNGRGDVSVAASHLSLNLDSSAYKVSLYDVVQGDKAISSISNSSSVSFTLGADPVVLEIQHLTPGGSGGTSTPTPNVVDFSNGMQTFKVASAALQASATHDVAQTVSNFAAGDVVDFTGIKASHVIVDPIKDQLTLTSDTGSTLATLHLTGDYTNETFSLSSDGASGTNLKVGALPSGTNSLAVRVSEDAYQGHAQFIVKVDGEQVGGVQTAQASHGSGQYEDVVINGNFGNANVVSVQFLNDAYGGKSTADRNLYVSEVSFNGHTYLGNTGTNAAGLASGTAAALTKNGAVTFNSSTHTNTLQLSVSEDAFKGDAQFIVKVDGQQIGGVQTAHASHAAGQTQAVAITGTFAANPNNVEVDFINDLYQGTAATDRNLYVDSLTVNGHTYAGTDGHNAAGHNVGHSAGMYSNGALTFHGNAGLV